ncbi:flavodoxin family protein [Ruminococcus sp. zg-924]|nr:MULTISPECIES: flavodoxin family protein [unclassified Ruminococcus]MCQ4023391.1 flavodoxin family protein [Ruminococcus sp. zg-924]MCQ4115764.1 flavodoxin family protein [Ruminococcus sp. zg-921]
MNKEFKVLMLNGSPRINGNTTIVLKAMEKIFTENGIVVENVQVGNKDIRGCIACGTCFEKGKCVFDDIVNELAPKFQVADGLVIASPVYYASANATLIACLDRLFYSTDFDKTMKVGASVACARRGGCSATFDELNKYFTIANMPIASSQYWNSIHGREKGQAEIDEEGMQTMRALARNMSFLIKSIALGKEQYGLPEKEQWTPTHFIR